VTRGRPRQHDPADLLHHTRSLWAQHGTAGVTIRALAARAGVGNGVIYSAFGSRSNLLARAWCREARGFLAYQHRLVDEALHASGPGEAVAEAALALATYARSNETGSRILLAAQARELMAWDLGPEERAEVEQLRSDVGGLVTRLAEELWGRTDARAVALVRICVVDLPGRLLLRDERLDSELAQHALREAVRGITAAEPPTAR